MPRRRRSQTATRRAVSVYIDEPIYKLLEDAAIKERRSISNQMVVMIEEAFLCRRRSRGAPAH